MNGDQEPWVFRGGLQAELQVCMTAQMDHWRTLTYESHYLINSHWFTASQLDTPDCVICFIYCAYFFILTPFIFQDKPKKLELSPGLNINHILFTFQLLLTFIAPISQKPPNLPQPDKLNQTLQIWLWFVKTRDCVLQHSP